MSQPPAPARGHWGKATLLLAVLGATVGASLDALHVHTGTTAYTHPDFFGIAWWVFPEFGAAAVGIGLARPLWERLLERRTPSQPAWSIGLAMALFVLAYALSGTLPADWTTRSLVLVVIFGTVWAVCDRSMVGMFLAVSTALLGTSTEVALVRLDLFYYLHPNLSVVAGWLPWLYTTAAIAVGNLGKRLVDGPAPLTSGTPTAPT
ncbi:MAG TPA: hypothetical protein VMV18_07070 [bacterium]|nr:hypothetical protein [bacterium]